MSKGGYQLTWYNGWSPEERLATIPIQRAAIRDGRMPKPDRCSICGIAHGDDPANAIGLHDERYDRPLEAYPVCRRCHGLVHRRFSCPKAWQGILDRHGGRGAWFEKLSLDPACLKQPFEITYPDGL